MDAAPRCTHHRHAIIEESPIGSWRTITGTARGAHHVHAGLPNEDHVRGRVTADGAVIAVADGHGARQYVRAERGSRLATEAATAVLADDPPSPDNLPEALVTRWRELVAADLEADRPDPGSLGPHGPEELYGTTLLAAAATSGRLLLVQIGDGDVILGREDDPNAGRPIPPVPTAFPGATDSLVQPDAAGRVRIAVIEDVPDLVLLATDGLDAAEPGRDWHDTVLADARDILAGPDAQPALAAWCGRAAADGGDDTTIGLLART